MEQQAAAGKHESHSTTERGELVVRVRQSPVNPMRWSFQLRCGHDVWVTRKSRPLCYTSKREADGTKTTDYRYIRCPECEARSSGRDTREMKIQEE